MHGLAFIGIVVLLWRLIMRIKARRRGSDRRSPSSPSSSSPIPIDENPALDETMDLGFRVMSVQNSLMVSGTDDQQREDQQVSNLTEEPTAAVHSRPID